MKTHTNCNYNRLQLHVIDPCLPPSHLRWILISSNPGYAFSLNAITYQ